MCKKLTVLMVLMGSAFLLGPVPAIAHHSFAAEYDQEKAVRLEGTLVRILFQNPHAALELDVKDADGKVVRWRIECGPPNTLLRRGWRPNTVPPGTPVVVNGHAAKQVPNFANGTDIRFPDGRVLFIGSGGTGAPYDEKELPKQQ